MRQLSLLDGLDVFHAQIEKNVLHQAFFMALRLPPVFS
jgi:hypothetical protein